MKRKWHDIAKEALKKKKVTHNEVARRIGCGQSAASHKLSGRRGATVDEILIIADLANLDFCDLFTRSSKLSDPNEIKLIDLFRKLSDHDQKTALKIIKSLQY